MSSNPYSSDLAEDIHGFLGTYRCEIDKDLTSLTLDSEDAPRKDANRMPYAGTIRDMNWEEAYQTQARNHKHGSGHIQHQLQQHSTLPPPAIEAYVQLDGYMVPDSRLQVHNAPLYPADHTAFTLPCEFMVLGRCDRSYRGDDENRWINHIMRWHMCNKLPSKCGCWFCDEEFHADETSGGDKNANFVLRLQHIRYHIRDDRISIKDIRPDFALIRHLQQCCLIDKATFDRAKAYYEGPRKTESREAVDHDKNEPTDMIPEKKTKSRKAVDRDKGKKKQDSKHFSSRFRRLQTNVDSNPVQKAAGGTKEPVYSTPTEPITNSIQTQVPPNSARNVFSASMPNMNSQEAKMSASSTIKELDATNITGSAGRLLDTDSSRSCTEGSGKEDSVSRSSTDETAGELLLEARKTELVEHTMVWFKRWLDSKLSLLIYQRGGNPIAGGTGPSTQSSLDEQRQQFRAQKRQSNNDAMNERDDWADGNDDGDGEEPSGKKKARLDLEPRRKFACPFYQHDSAFFQNWRICPGPGWETVHRVKEHIYRRHILPKYRCDRCFEDLKDIQSLSAHRRMETPCSVLDYVPQTGFIDIVQEKQLRAKPPRTKTAEQKTEPERWAEMYHILFPDDQMIPSPYYGASYNGQTQSGQSGIEEYAAFIQRELPPLIRRGLNNIVEVEFEERLRSQIVELVRGLQVDLHRTFQDRHQRTTFVHQEASDPEGSVQQPPEAMGLDDLDFSAVLNDLLTDDLPQFLAPHASSPLFLDPQSSTWPAGSDSGYGSRVQKSLEEDND